MNKAAKPLVLSLLLSLALSGGPVMAQTRTAQTSGLPAAPTGLPSSVPKLPSGQPDMSRFSKPDSAGYRYSPGMTPAQQSQLRTLAMPARSALVSTSPLAATNLILNETRAISGIVLPLDQTYRTALERAALHVPVNLVTIGAPMRIPRVSETASGQQRSVPKFSILVTSTNIIFLGPAGVEIYSAPSGTAALQAKVTQLQQALSTATRIK